MDLSQVKILNLLNHISIFAGIGFPQQQILADKCVIVEQDADEIVIEQGESGDCLYGIIKGKVLVSKKTKSHGWMQITTLETGDVFGEIAILRNIPRTSRVTTQTPCTFLTITAKDFLEVYQYFPAKSRDNIQLVIAKRLKHHGE